MIALVAAALLGAAASPAQDEDWFAASRENDAFVPVAAAAQEALLEGDARIAAGDPTGAFDAWYGALRDAAESDAVPRWIEGPGTDLFGTRALCTEGVDLAVARRLAALPAEARAQWRERFAAAAAMARRQASDEAALARVEFEYPATLAAASAVLTLADLALERGAIANVHVLLERARRHGALAEAADVSRALAARERAAAAWPGPATAASGPSGAGDWRRARSLEEGAFVPVAFVPEHAGQAAPGLGFDRGTLPGMTLLADGRVAAQYPEQVLLLDADRADGRFDPRALFVEHELPVPTADFAPPGDAWPLLPLALPPLPADEDGGGDLLLVLGRGFHGGRSALARVRPPRPGVRAPQLRWAWTAEGSWRAGAREGWPLAPGTIEFQPGALLLDERVFVQVRRFEPAGEDGAPATTGKADAWLMVLDARDGALLDTIALAKGAGVRRDLGRFAPPRVAAPALPLAAAPGAIVVGTGLGVIASIDPARGRITWTFRLRRRDAERPGWAAFAPPPIALGDEALALVAPGEGDLLYFLRAGATLADELFARAPLVPGEARALVTGDRDAVLFTGTRGARRTMFALAFAGAGEDTSPRRIDAVDARAGERLCGMGLASPERALLCTDRTLYLLDRSAELRLLDALSLPHGGGRLAGHGDRLYVAAQEGVQVLLAAP